MVNAKKSLSSDQSARDPDLTRPSALYCAAAHSRGNGGDPRERNKSNNNNDLLPPPPPPPPRHDPGDPGARKTAPPSGSLLSP